MDKERGLVMQIKLRSDSETRLTGTVRPTSGLRVQSWRTPRLGRGKCRVSPMEIEKQRFWDRLYSGRA